MKFKTLDQQYS